MKRVVVLMMTLFLLTGCTASGTKPSDDQGYQQITMKEAAERMGQEEDYVLLDVRTEEEFSDKHIPGAVNVPNEEIGTEVLDELPNLDQLIFVYCRSGNRSKKAAEKMAAIGYNNVIEIGGINDWTGDVVSGQPES